MPIAAGSNILQGEELAMYDYKATVLIKNRCEYASSAWLLAKPPPSLFGRNVWVLAGLWPGSL